MDFYNITRTYKNIVNGIAFLPTVISIGMLLAAILINATQISEERIELLNSIKFIQFESPDTVRSLLSALLAGTISIAVFSFTMVMVVVNQSASNYSPKVIDEFINKPVIKVILGIYIGTILFIIVSLTQIGDSENFSDVPHLNVIVSILLIALCIALFIVFIENISSSVRINNVIDRIFSQTKEALKRSRGNEIHEQPHAIEWFPYKVKNSGYFQSIVSKRLLMILKENQLILLVKPYYGNYLLPEHILFYLNRKIENEDLLDRIKNNFITYSGENITENYLYGFRQLREVSVKALSPGINDPGISIICLDYLSELLSIYGSGEYKNNLADKDGNIRIWFKRHTFSELIDLTILPIVSYGKSDFLVLSQVLLAMGNISLIDDENKYQATLIKVANFALETARENIKSIPERDYINNIVNTICVSGYFDLKPLVP